LSLHFLILLFRLSFIRALFVIHILLKFASTRHWQWCITLQITEFLHHFHWLIIINETWWVMTSLLRKFNSSACFHFGSSWVFKRDLFTKCHEDEASSYVATLKQSNGVRFTLSIHWNLFIRTEPKRWIPTRTTEKLNFTVSETF
jgi:hypothetical protein